MKLLRKVVAARRVEFIPGPGEAESEEDRCELVLEDGREVEVSEKEFQHVLAAFERADDVHVEYRVKITEDDG